METLNIIIDLFLHLDEHLNNVVTTYGVWTYVVLFAIIFLETGVVITPFLPGDSLLFVAGALSAIDGSPLNAVVLFVLLFSAAVIGDTVNYWIGQRTGPSAFNGKIRFLKREHLEHTRRFYEKHGGKTIVLARFIPIVRTLAPFVAGIGTMQYSKFIGYNLLGAFLWTGIFIYGGYFFGNIPYVEKNFEVVIVAIVFLSVVPMTIEYVRNQLRVRAVKPI